MPGDTFVVAQLSDIHCGSAYFDAHLLETAVKETIAVRPDLVAVGGDLTAEGYAHEFQMAQEYLQPLFDAGLSTIVIPGNHDSKNVGYLHFRDAFGSGDNPAKGDRAMSMMVGHPGSAGAMAVQIVAIDSTKPDLNEGEIGRERYDWIREKFAGFADLRVFLLHHHLVPVPGTGRERNTVWDSGDVLSLLDELGVDLVLSGHKHVPHVWLLNRTLMVNSGTVSTYRLRGYTRPSYNLVEITPAEIKVTLRYPGTGERVAATFDRLVCRVETNSQLNAMFDKAAWSL